jgi:DNA-binding NarL/FixJ family response regulator
MNKNFRFYFFGFEPVFIVGLSSILRKICSNAEIIDKYEPSEDTFESNLDGYVFISKTVYVNFFHMIKAQQNNKIIVLFDDIESSMLSNIFHVNVVACFTYDVDISEIEFGLNRVIQGHKYISQNILQDLLPNLTFNKKELLKQGSPINKMSKNEFAIFKHLQNGLGNKEIYSLTGLKPSTISTYKKRIFEKFNTKSIVKINELLNR